MLSMALYIIGLGLWDERDISLKGLETAKKCDLIYLENYTSVMFGTTVEKLEKLFGRKIEVLGRKEVEQDKEFLKQAKTKEVALLVGGDPTVATTHIEIIQEAKKQKVKFKVIHASSILSAVGESGLFTYKFGRSCSVPFPQKGFEPKSFYDIIAENQKIGAHTLVFLDLKPEENKFMTINEGLKILLEIGKKRKKEIDEETIAIGFARIGSDSQIIKSGKISELLKFDFGLPLHIIVIPGKLHFIEKEALVTF
jgi:diphthine synthase